jgi:hypothetical protein
MHIGGDARVEVFFNTEIEWDGRPDGVDLIVALDSAVSFLIGSAELYDGTTDDHDRRPPDSVAHCADGRTFLSFNYTDDDLEHRMLFSSGEFGMRFTIIGEQAAPAARIAAAAAQSQPFSCESDFPAEKDDFVAVLP